MNDIPATTGHTLAGLLEKLGDTDKVAADILTILETRIGIHARTLTVLEENIRRTDKRVKKLAARTVSQHDDIETVTAMLEDYYGPKLERLDQRIQPVEGDVNLLRHRANDQGQRINTLEAEAAGTTGEIQALTYRLEALEARAEAADPDATPDPLVVWRQWVVLPHEVAAGESVACLLSWLACVGSPSGVESRLTYLGGIVALAERQSGEPADPGAVIEDGEWRVESVLWDLMLAGGVNWCWVADYAAAWLMHLCTDGEAS